MLKDDMEKYTEAYVGTLLGIALFRFYKYDQYLVENKASERSMTHRLAVYLEQLFPEFNVDCEYNRDADGKDLLLEKRINFNCIGCPEEDTCSKRKECQNELIKNMGNHNHIFHSLVLPDIIIHRRGPNVCNLLAIEAKKSYNISCERTVFDRCKLRCYKKNLNYKFVAFIPFLYEHKNFRLNFMALLDRVEFPDVLKTDFFKKFKEIFDASK